MRGDCCSQGELVVLLGWWIGAASPYGVLLGVRVVLIKPEDRKTDEQRQEREADDRAAGRLQQERD